MNAVKDAQYTVLTRDRPIRVAFLINTDSFTSRAAALDALADSIVDWNHAHWGDRTNPIIFFNGNTLTKEDWQHLELADPDCISVVGHITKDLVSKLDDRLHPWGFEVNDKPDNGLALCPNHHWAMDRFLIAPCRDPKCRAGIWRADPALDRRIEGQKDLLALAIQPVIPPSEEKFYPAIESLRWREKHLNAKY